MNASKPLFKSSVYGPVHSWRVGNSLGIDLICETSVCSFNCIYCQLGRIQHVTSQRQEFVTTEKVVNDFQQSNWRQADIITYSGSGEPTLATNLGAVAQELKRIIPLPQLVLTNGTLLNNPEVIGNLQHVDRVFVKLDASSETIYQRVNRPVEGISLETIVENAAAFRKVYRGFLGIQTMFIYDIPSEIDGMVDILNKIQPDQVQLNTPKRPYPKSWHISSRGGHTEELREYESVPLRNITPESASLIEKELRDRTGLEILSVYRTS